MLSRVADSLYWMGRYMERTDGILRMLKINYASSQDDIQEFSWIPVLRIFTYLNEEEAAKIADDSQAVIRYMMMDKNNPNSVVNIVTMARENARSVQDHITIEVWQCLNELYHAVREERLTDLLQREDPITILDELIKKGMLYYGTADITMARGLSYSFISVGKFLERGIQTADILDTKFSDRNFTNDSADILYWKYLLMSVSGYELYLKTYRSGFEFENVIEQLVLNSDFPRSLMHSVSHLHTNFNRLQLQQGPTGSHELERRMGKLSSDVQYSTARQIMNTGLHVFLTDVKKQLHGIADLLNQKYFAPT
jgi:uncharacterized alpha-E superfamily protein